MPRLRAWVHAVIFYGGSVGFVLLAPLVALAGQRPLRRWVRGWALWHRWCARVLLGITSRIEGIVPDRPLLVAGRHEAMFETVELVIILREPVIVLKQELARIPFWGWTARRYGMIPVDRTGSASALRAMVRAAKAAFDDGRPVVIFPEGTRMPHGTPGALRAGFAGLYRALGAETVPLAVDSGRLMPRGGTPRPGAITFRFGAPVPAGLKRAEVEARVFDGMNALNPPGARPPSVVGPPEIGA